jgi:GNAT superfamily N-acetyltransferase
MRSAATFGTTLAAGDNAMKIDYRCNLDGIDWIELKSTLAADHFDNGRSPEQLERSFRNSHSVCIAWSNNRVIGTARVLSDGVCNAYLIDVWTLSELRKQGIARRMIESLLEKLPGQHVYLQSDADTLEFYNRIGFSERPTGLEKVVGQWLKND